MWWSSRLFFLACLMLVQACGFQPRGKASLPESVQAIHIATNDRYSPFYRQLTTVVRSNGVKLTADPDAADAVIRVSRDDTGRRVLSVSPRNVPAEYDVFYTVSYAILVDGAVVFEPQTLTLNRDYTYEPTQVLGKTREEDEIRNALAADLAGLVTRRLNALN